MRRALLALLLLVVIAPGSVSVAASGPVRSTVDRPGTTGLRVHLVYLVPKGAKDLHRDVDGSLVRAAEGIQAWFRRETGGRQVRLDTYRVGGTSVPDITFVRSARTDYSCVITGIDDTHCEKEIVDSRTGGQRTAPVDLVDQDLAKAGLAAPGVRYLVLVQGGANIICGMSQGPEDGDRDATHVGRVAAVFLGAEYCPNEVPGLGGQVDWELVHEYLHQDGAVPLGAPHQCAGTSGHVCTGGLANASPYSDPFDPQRADILYPSPGIALGDAHLDPGHDDYYGTAVGLRDVEDSPYLTAIR